MDYQGIVKKAWRLTVEHRYLVSFGTIASFFAILIGAIRLRYLLPEPTGTMNDIWDYFSTNTDRPVLYIIIFSIIYSLVYLMALFTNIISNGAMISSIAKIEDQNTRLSFSKSLSLAINCFLPLVKYKAVTTFFNIGHFIIYVLLIRFYIRIYFDDYDILKVFWPLILFMIIIIAVISVGLTYGEYNLVIHRDRIFKSIRKSITLVMFHFSETLLITILVLLITIRTLINILLVFIVPSLIFTIVGYLSFKLSAVVAISVGATFALVILWFSARLSGTLMVFITAVWTLTYLKLDEQKAYKILKNESDDKYLDMPDD